MSTQGNHRYAQSQCPSLVRQYIGLDPTVWMPLSQCHQSTQDWKTPVDWSSWETVSVAGHRSCCNCPNWTTCPPQVCFSSQLRWSDGNLSLVMSFLLKILQRLYLVISKGQNPDCEPSPCTVCPLPTSPASSPSPLCSSHTGFFHTRFSHAFVMPVPLFGMLCPLLYSSLH